MKSVIEIPEPLQHLSIEGSPQEIEGNACVGDVFLLPSGIEPRVGLRCKSTASYYSPNILLSCVTLLKPATQVVSVDDQNEIYGGKGPVSPTQLEVPVPELMYVADINFAPRGHEYYPERVQGYLFRYDNSVPLPDAYGSVEHYFFPHIYHDAHLCVMSSPTTPRQLLSYFWSSNFHNNWWDLFDNYRDGNFEGGNLVIADGPSNYIKYQNEAKAPILDKKHQGFLAGYTDHLHVEAKPIGVFASHALVDDSEATIVSSKPGYDDFKLFTGFAFHANDGHCWVYTKDQRLLRLRPEQVKVV